MTTPGLPVPALHIDGVTKRYQGLRPLRIASLTVLSGERVSVAGIDAGAGEVLVNLVTGATLPDTGDVRVFGRATSEIASAEEWLVSLDPIGICSPRAVLLEASTIEQNLALSFTLQIDPVPAAVSTKARALAARCGIDPDRWLDVPAGDLPADLKVRVHLARALALDPRLLLIEHPTTGVDSRAAEALARDVVRACEGGGVATLVLTADEGFGRRVAPRNFRLHGATGELKPLRRGWFTS